MLPFVFLFPVVGPTRTRGEQRRALPFVLHPSLTTGIPDIFQFQLTVVEVIEARAWLSFCQASHWTMRTCSVLFVGPLPRYACSTAQHTVVVRDSRKHVLNVKAALSFVVSCRVADATSAKTCAGAAPSAPRRGTTQSFWTPSFDSGRFATYQVQLAVFYLGQGTFRDRVYRVLVEGVAEPSSEKLVVVTSTYKLLQIRQL